MYTIVKNFKIVLPVSNFLEILLAEAEADVWRRIAPQLGQVESTPEAIRSYSIYINYPPVCIMIYLSCVVYMYRYPM